MADERDEAISDTETEQRDNARTGPLVFISHDTRDAPVAEALGELLGRVSMGMLKTFRSSDRTGGQGIEYGVEWYPEIMRQLDSACDVVCLLTERSLDRPWLLYEAGVAKGKLNIPVHGLALGVPLSKANTGPFAQFQNCGDDVESMTGLVEQLVRRLPNADPDHEMVRGQVEAFKHEVEDRLAAQATGTEVESVEPDPVETAKLFEEIKVMFQDLPSRIESVAVRAGEPDSRRSSYRMNSEMMRDLAHTSSRENPSLPLLFVASEFRDTIPWLYELALEMFRQFNSRNFEGVQRLRRDMLFALDLAAHAPFARGLRLSKHHSMALRDLEIFTQMLLPVPEEHDPEER